MTIETYDAMDCNKISRPQVLTLTQRLLRTVPIFLTLAVKLDITHLKVSKFKELE